MNTGYISRREDGSRNSPPGIALDLHTACNTRTVGVNRDLGLIDLWRVWPDRARGVWGGGDTQFRSVSCLAVAAGSSGSALHQIARRPMNNSEAIMAYHRTAWILGCLAGFIASGAPGLSSAQAAASASVTPASGVELQEVIVTAERRDESSQSVPISVSVITGDGALNSGITTSEELPLAVPGLQMDLDGIGLSPFLRGVGSSFYAPSAESSVAIYMDGGYLPSEAALFNLNNIDRVEVLKGPQGTLFGRNATGGVIQVITKEPSSEPSADLSVGYGNYQTSLLNFYGTTGVAAGLATDMAVYADDNPSGWGRNLFNADQDYTYENIDVRNTWLWQSRNGARESNSHWITRTLTNEAGLGFKPVPGTVTVAGTTYPGFYDTDSNPAGCRTVMHQGGALLQVSQDLQFATFKSISTYRELRPNFFFDQDASPLPIANLQVHDPDNSITQELQLIAPEPSKLQWIGGFFYYHDVGGFAPLDIQRVKAAAPLPARSPSLRDNIPTPTRAMPKRPSQWHPKRISPQVHSLITAVIVGHSIRRDHLGRRCRRARDRRPVGAIQQGHVASCTRSSVYSRCTRLHFGQSRFQIRCVQHVRI